MVERIAEQQPLVVRTREKSGTRGIPSDCVDATSMNLDMTQLTQTLNEVETRFAENDYRSQSQYPFIALCRSVRWSSGQKALPLLTRLMLPFIRR